MEKKFTPGPWYHEGDSLAIFHPTEIGVRLAIVERTYSGSGWSIEPNDEYKANSKLIAASPELFEALVMAMDYIHSNSEPFMLPDDFQKWQAVIDKIVK